MSLLAIGDLHISQTIWERYKGITGDSVFMLDQIKGLLTGDDDLVLCGDIFDSSEPGPVLGRILREWAEEVTAAGNRLWVFQGNHDKRAAPWPLALSSCMTYIGDGAPVTIAGRRVRALDYGPRDYIAKRLAEMGTQELPEILFLHQSVRQYLDFENSWNCDLEWVPAGIPLIVLGDIHEPWSASVRAGQTAVYTGAGHTRSITEAKWGKSVLCISTPDDPSALDRLQIRSRAIMAASLTAATLETTREAVRAWVKDLMAGNRPETAPVGILAPVVYLTYTDDVPSAASLLQEAVADLGVKMFVIENPITVRAVGTTRVDLAAAVNGIPTIPALLAASGLAKTEAVSSTVLDLIRPGKASEIRCRLDILRSQFFKDWDQAHS